MKKIILSIALCLSCIIMHAQQRQILELDKNWKFFKGSDLSSDDAPLVNLPHTWNHDAVRPSRDYYRGIGNYLKELEVPMEWMGKRIFIKCYGANSVSNLFVNGRHVGEHRGGYTAFCYEITDYLRFGRRNYLWFMVNNSPQLDVLPTAGDMSCYGGLFRNVEVIIAGRDMVSLVDQGSEGVFIKQRNITPAMVEAEAEVKVNGVRDNTVTAELTVYNHLMEPVATNSSRLRLSGRTTSTVSLPFSFANPRLWHGTEDPYLYFVAVKIIENDNSLSDSTGFYTGFRYFNIDDKGRFYLNGRPYRIKGVVTTQDRPISGPAITNLDVKEDFDIIREMGANAVKVNTLCHHPYFYELCDRYGVIILNDMPLVGSVFLSDRGYVDSEPFATNGFIQAEEIIRQKYNHPSILFWNLFNDLTTRGDNPVDYISSLNLMLKREDPYRLTTATSNIDGEINFISDLIIWNHFFGWKEGAPGDIDIWRRQLHQNWTNLKSAVTFSAGASIRQQDDSLYRPVYTGNWHPERWQTNFHEEYYKILAKDDQLWALFVGNMFDYGAAGRTWGEGLGINDCGLVTFDRKYKKDAFFLYKANWNQYDPFVYIAERRWDVRKDSSQVIKVFTNQSKAELFVNGQSLGINNQSLGQIIWEGVELLDGFNVLEVVAGDYHDSIIIRIKG